VQHLVLVHDAQTAQHLVVERADGRLAEDLLLLEFARGDDELLQGRALEVVHDHVDGFVLAEEVEHAHHRLVGDLRQRAAFFEEALEAQAVQRQLFGLHLRQQLARCTRGQRRRQVFLDRDLLAFGIHRQVNHAETTGSEFANDAIAADHRVGRQGCGFDL